MTTQSLKHKTSKSFFWVTIDMFSQKIFQLVFTIILARLLLPQEFGLIALLAVFMSISKVFIDSGFSFALIRQKNVENIEYLTVFWFNLIISIVFYFILYFSSGLIAGFYQQEILSKIIKIYGLLLIINALGTIQSIKLRKDLKFKQIAIITFISKIISASIALIMAYKGYGVWSLVLQEILWSVVNLILMMFINRFLPKLLFSFQHFKKLFSFGSKLLYGSMINSIVSNIYPMVIGKVFTIADVGFFNRAQNLQQLPVGFFTSIVQQVTLPTFAKIQDEDVRFLKGYRIAIKMTLFVALLPLCFLVVSAYPLIEFLLTSKWLPSAPMLQILAIGGVFYPLSALNVNIIGIKGRTDLVMVLQFIKDGLTVIGVVIGLIFGIYGLVWSFAITSNLCFFLNIYFTSKVVNYSIKKQLTDIVPIIFKALVVGLLVFVVTSFVTLNILALIILQGVLISIFYIGYAWLMKLPEFTNAVDLLYNMTNRNK